jgi:cystathionine beta-lyase
MSPRIESLSRDGTHAKKWERYRGRDILPFWVADMDFATAPCVDAAIRARTRHPIYGYTGIPPSLVDAALAWLERRYAWRVPAEWLVFIAGVVPGFNVACRAVGRPGDRVLVPVPVYPPIIEAPAHSGREVVRVPMDAGDHRRHRLDIERLQAAVDARTRLVIVCNPQNPTGRVASRDELLALAAFCERNDLVLVSDEIHCPLVLDPACTHVPVASLDPAIAARTITLLAPSKAYNIPGLSCAFAIIADPALRAAFHDAGAGFLASIGPLAFVATEAALREDGSWLSALLDVLRTNRDRVAACVGATRSLRATHVEGTYLTWIDARAVAPVDAGAHFERHGLGLSEGADFGAPGHVRFNFGCSPALLERGLERLARAAG